MSDIESVLLIGKVVRFLRCVSRCMKGEQEGQQATSIIRARDNTQTAVTNIQMGDSNKVFIVTPDGLQGIRAPLAESQLPDTTPLPEIEGDVRGELPPPAEVDEETQEVDQVQDADIEMPEIEVPDEPPEEGELEDEDQPRPEMNGSDPEETS